MIGELFDNNTKVLIIILIALFFILEFYVYKGNEKMYIFPIAMLCSILLGFVTTIKNNDELELLFAVALSIAIAGGFTMCVMPKTLFCMKLKLSDGDDSEKIKEHMTLKPFCDERALSCLIACSNKDRRLNRDCYEECKKNSPIC